MAPSKELDLGNQGYRECRVVRGFEGFDDLCVSPLQQRQDIGIQEMRSKTSLHFGTPPSLVDLGDQLVHRLVVLEGTCLFKKDRLAVASSQPVL